MKLAAAKEWIVAISASVSMLSVAIGIWQTLADYQLKLIAEERLAFSSKAETDIRLINAFNEVIVYASGDRKRQISEKTIELLFQKGFITKSDLDDPKKLNGKLETAASFGTPINLSAAIASTVAMAELAIRYPILRESAMLTMNRNIIKSNSPEAVEKYLETLRKLQPDKEN